MMEGQTHQVEINESAYPRRVVVKFQDSLDVPYEDGVEKDFPEDMRKQWEELVKTFPGITLKRLYTTTSPDRIRELVNQAIKLDPDYRPPNFLTYFVIDVPPEADPSALLIPSNCKCAWFHQSWWYLCLFHYCWRSFCLDCVGRIWRRSYIY